MSIPIYLAFSPEEAAQAAETGHPLACMGCRLDETSPALLVPDPAPDTASMMLLQDDTSPDYEPDEALAALICGYASSVHTGLVCDFDRPVSPFYQRLARLLDRECASRRFPLWVSASYADEAPNAWVLVGSDVTCGPFERRLREAAARRPGQCVLELRPLSHRYSLPDPTGDGEALTTEAREEFRAGAPAFDAEDLVCRWFTRRRNGVLDLVLYDTRETLAQKLRTAEALGFRSAIGLLQELRLLFA